MKKAKKAKKMNKYQVVFYSGHASSVVSVKAYTKKQAKAYFKKHFGLRIANIIKEK